MLLSALFLTVLAGWATAAAQRQWPYRPLTSSGRFIYDARGQVVVYAGTNWPGCLEPMVPEGLQHASVEATVDKIASLGMNVVRLGWATEMIDDIYSNNGRDTDLRTTFVDALGKVEGERVLRQVLANNPEFTPATTRLEVFGAVVDACARRKIWVHLDNHQAKAGWCCNATDGNGWFGAAYFNVDNWIRGLTYMARLAQTWPNVVSMSLYNELRETVPPTPVPYGWEAWYEKMVAAGEAVHAANDELLVFLSGLNYDLDVSPLVSGQTGVGPGCAAFNASKLSFAHRAVLELHDYSWDQAFANCSEFDAALDSDGWYVLDMATTRTVENRLPVVMTEFGFAPQTYPSLYAQCLKRFLGANHAGWTMWDLCGSYYIREGVYDMDETWGLLNANWSGWRNESAMQNYYIPLIQASLSKMGST